MKDVDQKMLRMIQERHQYLQLSELDEAMPLLQQERDQARNALREKKYEEAYAEWTREVRARAYVELRDPPQ